MPFSCTASDRKYLNPIAFFEHSLASRAVKMPSDVSIIISHVYCYRRPADKSSEARTCLKQPDAVCGTDRRSMYEGQ